MADIPALRIKPAHKDNAGRRTSIIHAVGARADEGLRRGSAGGRGDGYGAVDGVLAGAGGGPAGRPGQGPQGARVPDELGEGARAGGGARPRGRGATPQRRGVEQRARRLRRHPRAQRLHRPLPGHAHIEVVRSRGWMRRS